MANKLFVGGLPFNFTDDKLRELFAPLGTVVSAIMVQDPKNGRTRGFGFVAMSSDDESLSAIEALKGKTIDDKAIWVTEAREKPQQQSRPPQSRPPRNEGFPQAPRWEGRRPGARPSGPPRGRGSFDRPSGPPRGRGRNEPYRFQERGPRREGGAPSFPPRPQSGFDRRPPRDENRSFFKPDSPGDRRPPSRDARPGAWRGPRPTSFGDRRPRPEGGRGPSDRPPFRGPKPFDRGGPKPYGRGPSPSRGPSRFSEDRSGSSRPPRSGKPGGPDPAHHKFGKFFKKSSRPSDRGDRPDGPPRRSGPRH